MTTTELMIHHKGWAVWTRPGITLDDAERARIASAVEHVFATMREVP